MTKPPYSLDHSSSRYPSVTAIVPITGVSDGLAETLESLLSQTIPLGQIIVVSDHAASETEAVVKRFGSRIRMLSKPPGSRLAAVNHGLAVCTSDFVWIMDASSIAPIDAVSNLLVPFSTKPELGISYGRYQTITNRKRANQQRLTKTSTYPSLQSRSVFTVMMEDAFLPSLSCVMARRACYEAISPLREDLTDAEDYYALLRLARAFPAESTDAVTLLRRSSNTSATSGASTSAAETRLIAELLPTVSLGELIGRHYTQPPTTPLELRQAFFQKAAIAARRKLWAQAIDGIERGVNANPVTPLRDIDTVILKKLLGCRYGLDELVRTPGILDHVRSAFSEFYPRGAARRAIASSLLYRIRARPFDGRNWSLYWRFCGLFGGLSGVLSTFQLNDPKPSRA